MGDPDFTWDYCWATQMAELVLGECPASYSCEVLVLVIAVMEFLLLRFAAIILMARSPIIIATPIFSPSAVGRTPTVRGGRRLLMSPDRSIESNAWRMVTFTRTGVCGGGVISLGFQVAEGFCPVMSAYVDC